MEPKYKTLGLFAVALSMIAIAAIVPDKPTQTPAVKPPVDRIVTADGDRPVVQVALLLDTSNSMDGLIDQARSELWRIVRQLSEGKRNGLAPRLELALYEYGNDGISSEKGHIRQVVGFTEEIDRVSEALFALATDGGSEFAGLAIRNAAVALPWSKDEGALKLIFIAGNESFAQGPVSPEAAMAFARREGIVVNPIFCGAMQAGISAGWKNGAMLAGGQFMAIDQNEKVVQISAPQDRELVRLNGEINDTFIPYGGEGQAGLARQAAQDSNSSGYGLANVSSRSSYKASESYKNPSWELVDAIDRGSVDIDGLKEESLPGAMKGLDSAGRRRYVETKRQERQAIQQRIRELTAERDAFVAKEREKLGQKDSLDVALLSAVEELAKAKGFSFE